MTRSPYSPFSDRHNVSSASATAPPPTTSKPPPPLGLGRAATPEGEAARKANISAAMKGRVPWNAGRRHSPETIARIRASTAAAMARPDVKARVDAGRGRRGKVHHSDETRAKIKATMQASADAAARAAGRPTRAEREAAKEARAAERLAKKEAAAAEAAAKAEERRAKREAVVAARAARARRVVVRGERRVPPRKVRGRRPRPLSTGMSVLSPSPSSPPPLSSARAAKAEEAARLVATLEARLAALDAAAPALEGDAAGKARLADARARGVALLKRARAQLSARVGGRT